MTKPPVKDRAWTRSELALLDDDAIAVVADRVLNTLAKWRLVFAGWQLGTRPSSDPEAQAVRDQRELFMVMRVELNALTKCLLDAGVFSARDFTEQTVLEAEHLNAAYEQRFPGIKATETGIVYDLPLASETMKRWLP